jgi:hypothetical protein
MNTSGETGERPQPEELSTSAFPTTQVHQGGTGQSGKYLCLRCGWRWSPAGFPDPRPCRCRTSTGTCHPRARANRPDDPKWKAERDVKAYQRQAGRSPG